MRIEFKSKQGGWEFNLYQSSMTDEKIFYSKKIFFTDIEALVLKVY